VIAFLSVACSTSDEAVGTLSLSGLELSDGEGGDFALEHFVVSVEGIELAMRSGTEVEWVGLLEKGGWSVDLPAGTYPYVFLKLGDEMTWQRSESGTPCPEGTSSSDDAIASVLDEPDVSPHEVHRDANDGYFWVMIEEVTIEARETTELFLAAVPDSVEDGSACDDVPGKPFFLLGGEDALTEAYR
jgi:hypothetical protein